MNAISTFFVSIFIGLASLFGFQQTSPTPTDNLGAAVLPIAGSTYNLSGAGVSSSATSITLASLTIPQTGQKIQDSDLSSTFYITLEPGNRTRQELVSCTTVTQGATTATLSGCSRGLSPITPYTASSTLQFAHGGGSQVIFSDPPQLFNEFASKADDNTFLGVNRFNTYLPESSIAATSSIQLTNKAYVDSTANQGAATSTETNGGIVELGTASEQATSFDGGANKPTVLQTKYATNNCTGANSYTLVASSTTGKLDKSCFDQTSTYNFSATTTFATSTLNSVTITGSTTIAASNTTNKSLTLNGQSYAFPSTQGTSGSALVNNGSNTLSWISSRQYTYSTTTTIAAAGGTSVSSSFWSFPAGVITASSSIEITGSFHCAAGGSPATCKIYLKDSSDNLISDCGNSNAGATITGYGTFRFLVLSANSTSAQSNTCFVHYFTVETGSPNNRADNSTGTSALNLANATTLKLVLEASGAGSVATMQNYFGILTP